MAQMTHRERVWTTLAHQEPDRVPLDLGTGTSSTMVPEAHDRLLRHLKMNRQTRLMSTGFRLSWVDEEILRYFDIDTRAVLMGSPSQPTRLCDEPNSFYDDYGVLWRNIPHENGSYQEVMQNPLAEAEIGDLETYPYWPNVADPARYAGLADDIRSLYEDTDFALIAMPSFNSVWERCWLMRGFQQVLLDLVLNPTFVHALLRKVTDGVLECMKHFLNAVGPYAHIIRLGDDLGTQGGPLISPAMYRSFVQPYQREVIKYIKEHSDAKVWYHSCGSVFALLPDLIDTGIDILNPVQVSARDMDTRRLKQTYGDHVTFCGGVDTQHVLPKGTIDDVKREVELRIRDLAPGGGYILTQVHNIQDDVPPENVVAMFQHARRVGNYPIDLRGDQTKNDERILTNG